MPAATCAVCGIDFSARSDAVYCSSACRQKAYRARTARRMAALTARLRHTSRRALIRQDVARTLQSSRQQIEQSRELCRTAVERLQRSAALQEQFGRIHQGLATDAATTPTPRPDQSAATAAPAGERG
jgi:hypothetical protein